MVEDKSTITINDENPNVEVPTNSSTTEGADVTSNVEGMNVTSKIEETPKSEVSTDTSEIKLAETTSDVEEVDTTSKLEEAVLEIITSDETGIETETETEESTVNDVMQGNDTEPKQEPEESTAKAPAKEPKKTDDVEPWDDDAPVSEDDLIDELFYHGGIAKDVAKDMIEKLKAAKDAKLKANMINHIVWHIATGGPTNKTNGGKGKALHKKDILDYLKTL